MNVLAMAAAQEQLTTITGTVTMDALAVSDAKITLIDRNSRSEFSTTTGADGRFKLDVPSRSYFLLILGSLQPPAILKMLVIQVPVTRELGVDLSQPLSSGRDPSGSVFVGPGKDGGQITVGDGQAGGAVFPPTDPGPPSGSSKYALRLSGRAFLPRSFTEAAGYGLYSYVLFGAGPTDDSRKQYESAIRAFLQVIQDASQLEAAGLSKTRLNITYLPVTEPVGDDADAAAVLAKYDYSRSVGLLSKLPGPLRTRGPYIVSAAVPLSSAAPTQFLYQDLSSVPPGIIVPWVKAFVVQAAKERYWEQDSMSRLVLDVREAVEVVALASGELKPAIADWKSFLGSLISFNK
jgi:hypothetical protein